MKLFAFDNLKTGTSKAQLEVLLDEEVTVAWSLYSNGIIRENYLRIDRPGAVIVLECASIEEAHRHLDLLPFVKAGLVEFTVIPVGPFLTLGRLFRDAPIAAAG